MSSKLKVSVAIGVTATVIILLIYIGYDIKWTGFSEYECPKKADYAVHCGKTLWDWLKLLVAPMILALVGFVFTYAQSKDKQTIADNQIQEDALQAYFDKVSELLARLKKSEGENARKRDEPIKAELRGRTLAVLGRLNGERKAILLQFLRDSGSIDRLDTVVDLRHANLMDIKLTDTELSRANFSNARFVGADLRGANLSYSDVRGAVFTNAKFGDIPKLTLAIYDDETIWPNEEFRRGVWEKAKAIGPHAQLDKLEDSEKESFSRLGSKGQEGLNGALSGANLHKVVMYGINLENADLKNADLSEAILHGANLRNADLTKANLTGTDFQRADLSEANLEGACLKKSKLEKANLKGAKLENANTEGLDQKWMKVWKLATDGTKDNKDFSHVDLSYANLAEATLTDAYMRETVLNDSILCKAQMQKAKLQSAKLMECNLKEANLQNADLTGADLTGANMEKVDLGYAALKNTTLTGANLRGANLKNATFDSITGLEEDCLEWADLEDLKLIGATLPEKWEQVRQIKKFSEGDSEQFSISVRDLSSANLDYAKLSKTNLTDINFRGSSLKNAILEEAILISAIFNKAILKGASLKLADLTKASFKNANLKDANFCFADLRGADFSDAIFDEKTKLTFAIYDSNTKWRNEDIAKFIREEARALGPKSQLHQLTDDEQKLFSDLTDRCLECIDLKGANLKGINLEGMNLNGADLREAHLTNANLRTASLFDADLRGADLTGSDIRDVKLESSHLIDTPLTVERYKPSKSELDWSDTVRKFFDFPRQQHATPPVQTKYPNAILESVKYNDGTTFPDKFEIPESAVKVPLTSNTSTIDHLLSI